MTDADDAIQKVLIAAVAFAEAIRDLFTPLESATPPPSPAPSAARSRVEHIDIDREVDINGATDGAAD